MGAILCVVIIGGVTYIGFGLGGYYRNRYRFYQELKNFLVYAKTNISFSQKRLSDIIENYIEKGRTPIESILKEYLEYLSNLTTVTNYQMSDNGYIKTNEKEDIETFFNQLGRMNVESEVLNIDNFAKRMDIVCDEAKKFYTKYNYVFIQVGFVIGCLIVLIII